MQSGHRANPPHRVPDELVRAHQVERPLVRDSHEEADQSHVVVQGKPRHDASPDCQPIVLVIDCRLSARLAQLTITPRGVPVDPEVNCNSAHSASSSVRRIGSRRVDQTLCQRQRLPGQTCDADRSFDRWQQFG